MRLVVLALVIAATAATSSGPGSAREWTPGMDTSSPDSANTQPEWASFKAGGEDTPTASHVESRLEAYRECRRHRGLAVNTQTPSRRELAACRAQRAKDAEKDTHVAIRVTFAEPDWPAAICIVGHEGGRWNRAAPEGQAGEITSWQWHPGWWKPGHTFNGGPPVLDEQRLRESALYATRAARRLWERSGRTFRVHWVNSSRKCGL